MKKSTVISALLVIGLAGFGVAASGQDDESRMINGREQFYHPIPVDRLRGEVNHLNHMMTQVERALRTYHAPKTIWREYENVRKEAAVVNLQLRGKAIDRFRLGKDIEHMHTELHHIEEELHVPVQGQYQWR
jgi:hypothetical protein